MNDTVPFFLSWRY